MKKKILFFMMLLFTNMANAEIECMTANVSPSFAYTHDSPKEIVEEVITGLPVIDFISVGINTAIKIAGRALKKKLSKELGIQEYINIATEGIEELEDLWQESLVTIKQIVTDYTGLEAIIRAVSNSTENGIMAIGEIEHYEYLDYEKKEVMAKAIEYNLQISSDKLDDLGRLLEEDNGKLTDAERLDQIDKLRKEVAIANRDIVALRKKGKFLNEKFYSKNKNASKMNELFGG